MANASEITKWFHDVGKKVRSNYFLAVRIAIIGRF